MPEKIIQSNIVDEYEKDATEYCIEVNWKRQIADERDSNKPVQRRIQYSTLLKCPNTLVKSASIVGYTMQKFHPHGNTSIYEAFPPMANFFQINYPLLDAQGNMGNIVGDSPAAERYTEVKVSQFMMDVMGREILESKKIVDWIPTYDNKNMEPEYLPCKLPLALINGCFGIGYGIKSEIPVHNLSEVVQATVQLMDDPNADIVLIPDQCMETEVIDTNFKLITNKGHGSIVFRGLMHTETINGSTALVITSTPDMVFLNSVVEKIDSLVADKILPVVDSYDDSSETQIRYILILKNGADPEYCKDIIYKKTEMEHSVSVSCILLHDYNPIRFSYKSYLLNFIEFRKLTKFRVYCNKLQHANTKLHEKEAYIKLLQSGKIDEIQAMIRNRSKVNDSELIEKLEVMLGITDLQASFIINAGLKTVSTGYLNQYIEEAQKLREQIDHYLEMIHDESKIVSEIKGELFELMAKYGRPRKCKVVDGTDIDIPKGTFKVIITDNNHIKKVQENAPLALKGAAAKYVFKIENKDDILLFDIVGKVFRLPVSKIPLSVDKSNGVDIRTIKKTCTDICQVITEPRITTAANSINKLFLVAVTAKGNIKKMDLQDFMSVPASGLLYYKIDPDDIVKFVKIVPDGVDIIVHSGKKGIRLSMNDIPHQKRNNKGLKSMDTKLPIDGINEVYPNSTDMIVITDDGKINRVSVLSMPLSVRGKAGSNMIALSKTNSVVSVILCNINSTIVVTTTAGKMEIPVAEIPQGSSISSGTKMIPLKNDRIIKATIKM